VNHVLNETTDLKSVLKITSEVDLPASLVIFDFIRRLRITASRMVVKAFQQLMWTSTIRAGGGQRWSQL